MHELGLIIDVVDNVERYAEENNIPAVSGVVLTVGEGFSVIPSLMKNVYRQACRGTVLEDSELTINIVEAAALCRACQNSFNPLTTMGVCPNCSARDYEVTAGKEFEITSIHVPD